MDRGVRVCRITSFRAFITVFYKQFLKYPGYIWRGQENLHWKLESSLDRLMGMPPPKEERKRKEDRLRRIVHSTVHLVRFQRATLGRRGPSPPALDNIDEWWALGQHNGLKTPLLDWTRSPFVAAYFALSRAEESGSEGTSVIYGLHEDSVEKIGDAWNEMHKLSPASRLRCVRPNHDHNARLVAQNALFTFIPHGCDIEDMVKKTYSARGSADEIDLLKLQIKNVYVHQAMRLLNRMNINHCTLFPDLYGAAKFANRYLKDKRY